jgi:hypothetical protein
MTENDLDTGAIEYAAFIHAMADLGPFCLPPPEWWPPGPRGRAWVHVMIHREFGWAGYEYAKGLPLLRLH